MKIYINEVERDITTLVYPTISNLIESERIESRGTAIAVNNKIVKKTLWDTTLLKEGDKVSVVRIAFGG